MFMCFILKRHSRCVNDTTLWEEKPFQPKPTKKRTNWLHNNKLYSKPICEFCLQTVYSGFDCHRVSPHHVFKHVKSEAPLIRTDKHFTEHGASCQTLSAQTSENHIKPEVENQMFSLPIILCTSSQFSSVETTKILLLSLSERVLLADVMVLKPESHSVAF